VGGSRPPYDVDGYATHDVNLGANNDDRFGVTETSSPWFLKPWVLALWGLAVLLLIATIIYGLVTLATNNGGSPPAPTRPSRTTLSSTVPARTTTPSSTPPSTTAPPPETTTPEPAPPVTTQPSTEQQHPHRHWWNGNVPQLPGLPPIHVPGVNP
jgi:hypothetical protein